MDQNSIIKDILLNNILYKDLPDEHKLNMNIIKAARNHSGMSRVIEYIPYSIIDDFESMMELSKSLSCFNLITFYHMSDRLKDDIDVVIKLTKLILDQCNMSTMNKYKFSQLFTTIWTNPEKPLYIASEQIINRMEYLDEKYKNKTILERLNMIRQERIKNKTVKGAHCISSK